MGKGPYVSPSTGARKLGAAGSASTTRSPNVSNVFSHVPPSTLSSNYRPRTLANPNHSITARRHQQQQQQHQQHQQQQQQQSGHYWTDKEDRMTHDFYASGNIVTDCFKRYELLTEFINLKNPNHCPLGVYVMPSEENLYVWYGIIFVHQGLYQSGVFKFRLAIPQNYPEYPPSVTFMSDMFHPLIDGGGNLSLTQQFLTWRPYEDYIIHVLHYVKNIFKKAMLDRLIEKHCPNKEAFRMYKNEMNVFIKLSKQCAELSYTESYLYDHFPEDNLIRFSPVTDATFDYVQSKIFSDLPEEMNSNSKDDIDENGNNSKSRKSSNQLHNDHGLLFSYKDDAKEDPESLEYL